MQRVLCSRFGPPPRYLFRFLVACLGTRSDSDLPVSRLATTTQAAMTGVPPPVWWNSSSSSRKRRSGRIPESPWPVSPLPTMTSLSTHCFHYTCTIFPRVVSNKFGLTLTTSGIFVPSAHFEWASRPRVWGGRRRWGRLTMRTWSRCEHVHCVPEHV